MTNQELTVNPAPLKVAALVTTFNRRATTVSNLLELASSAVGAGLDLKIFVVDDLSPDGTAAAVSDAVPGAFVANGTGSLFWCGGTAAAFALAQKEGRWDGYLLFNDDVQVTEEGLSLLVKEFRSSESPRGVVMVGACTNADGQIAYSGYLRPSRTRPLRMVLIEPTEPVRRCDTFNGNVVLVSGPVMDRLGGVDPAFVHMFGDLDLGLRASRSGAAILLASRPVGRCDRGATAEQRLGGKNARARAAYVFRGPFGILPVTRFALRHGTVVAAALTVGRAVLARLAVTCGLRARL